MLFSDWRLRAVDALRSYFRREWNEAVQLNSQFVPPFVRRHLKKVYFLLFCASTSSAVGCYFGSIPEIGSPFAMLGTYLSLLCLYFVPLWKEKQRFCLFITAALFSGISLTALLSLLFFVDIGFLVTLLLAPSVGFGCFWAVSKWTDSFNLLFLRALLLCFPMVLAWLLIAAAVCGGETAHFKYQLYAATLGFMVYVATYSQEVALQARRADNDFVKHAIHLFTDFPPAVLNIPKFLMHTWRIRKGLYTPQSV